MALKLEKAVQSTARSGGQAWLGCTAGYATGHQHPNCAQGGALDGKGKSIREAKYLSEALPRQGNMLAGSYSSMVVHHVSSFHGLLMSCLQLQDLLALPGKTTLGHHR